MKIKCQGLVALAVSLFSWEALKAQSAEDLEGVQGRSRQQCNELQEKVTQQRQKLRRQVLSFCNREMPRDCQQSCFEKAVVDSSPRDLITGAPLNSVRVKLRYTQAAESSLSRFSLNVVLSDLWKERVKLTKVTCRLPEETVGAGDAVFQIWHKIEGEVLEHFGSLCRDMILQQKETEKRYLENLLPSYSVRGRN